MEQFCKQWWIKNCEY